MVVSHAGRKSKGSTAERSLMHKLWANGWACVRAAGSGSTQFPCPDLIVGNGTKRLALEVKATKDDKKYFPKEEIHNLKYFATKFGAEPYVVIKWDRKDFYFIHISDLNETNASFVANFELAQNKGFSFDEFII
jgi:holliday junction resolvase Hjr